MEAVEFSDKDKWNGFIARRNAVAGGRFLQSWEWGEFQKGAGRKVFRIAVIDNGEILAAASLARYSLPLGKNYLYCPRGPVFSHSKEHAAHNRKTLELLVEEIKKIARREKGIFFRLEPPTRPGELGNGEQIPEGSVFAALHYPLSTTRSIQPKDTSILDISRPEDEILAGMRQKTRYNIRLAEKRGVMAREASDEKGIEEFLKLIHITAERDGFVPHPDDYYRKMTSSFPEGFARIYVAEFEGKALAANMVVFFAGTATYLHGASCSEHRNLMAPYLLQWHTIKEAKKYGCKRYDFWGIKPEGAGPDHPWSGITRFKEGFGGERVSYAGAFDVIFHPFWHALYQLGRKIKSI